MSVDTDIIETSSSGVTLIESAGVLRWSVSVNGIEQGHDLSAEVTNADVWKAIEALIHHMRFRQGKTEAADRLLRIVGRVWEAP